MGKTFKSGYLSLKHSFNSLYHHQTEKKTENRKKRVQRKNYCNYLYKTCDTPEMNMTTKKVNTSVDSRVWGRRTPEKIGYCPNSAKNLNDIAYTVRLFAIDDNKYLPENFNSSNESSKIDMLNDVVDSVYLNNDRLRRLYADQISELQILRKQLKRRGQIGYFKGYTKDYKN